MKLHNKYIVLRIIYFFLAGMFLILLGSYCNQLAIHFNAERMPVFTQHSINTSRHFSFFDINTINYFALVDIYSIHFKDKIFLFSLGDIFIISGRLFFVLIPFLFIYFLIKTFYSIKN